MDSKNPSYNKKDGTAGINGQFFEIYMTLYFLLEGFYKHDKNELKEFLIASNMEEAGLFDDIVFNYSKTVDNLEEKKTIFIQLKHKDKPNNTKEHITLDKLLLENRDSFTIKHYFQSYRSIKKRFSAKNLTDPTFGGKFENCDFIIFTNAKPHKKFNENNSDIIKENIGEEHILKFDQTNYYYKIVDTGNQKQEIINVLKNASDCLSLARQIIESVFPDDINKTAELKIEKLIKQYKFPLAESVIEKIRYGEGGFKTTFINDENLSESERIFRNTFFEELQKKKEFSMKSKTDTILEVQNKKFKLPAYFYETNKTIEFPDLPNDLVNTDEIHEFLNKLKIYINQPGTDDLKKILTKKIETYYAIEERDSNDIFSIIIKKVENWWTYGKEYLSEKNKNDFLDLMRISIQFEVDAPVLNFTGREDELKNLHINLTENTTGNVSVISQMTSVSGLGGIGKTELAKQYIHKYHQFYNYNIIWLNSENEDILTESFKRLCNKLKINITDTNNQPIDFRSIVGNVFKFFANRKSIFVFDNVEKTKYIDDCLRLQYSITNSNKPYILITSRDREWQNEIKVIELQELKIEDAITLVKLGLNITDDSEDEFVLELVTKLQCYPLAIQQAISYILSENEVGDYEISDYINEFDSQSESLLDSDKFRGIANKYDKTTFTTWKITKEKIESDKLYGKLALEILNILSYFSPDNINRDMFLKLVDNDERKLKNAVRLLVKLSMVNGKEKQSILSIHRLVQEVTRIELELKNDTETILKKALQIIENVMDEKYFYLDHAITTWNYSKEYVSLLKQFQNLPIQTIRKLYSSIRYKEVIEFGNTNLKIFVKFLEPDNENIFIIKGSIVSALYGQGKYEDALEMTNEIYEERKEILGETHPSTLITKYNIAMVLHKQGKYEDALAIYNETYESQKVILGETDPETLSTKHNIAFILKLQGKYKDALEIYNEIYEKQTKILGETHPLTIQTKHNIATVLDGQGKYKEALEIYKEIYEKEKEILGETHLDTLITKCNIAFILKLQGKYEDAFEIYNEIYEKQKEILGETHPETLTTKHDLVMVLDKQGKYKEALEMYNEIYEKQKEILGETHPETLTTKDSIAMVLYGQGKYEIALEIYNEIYEKRKEILGETHPETLTTKHDIAMVLDKQGKYKNALEIYNEIYEKQKEILGETHPETLTTKHSIAMVLYGLGKYEDALEMYNEIYEKRKEIIGETNPETLTTKHDLAMVLDKQGEYKRALEIYNEIYEKRKEILGETHPETLTTKYNIARALYGQGKNEDALEIYKEIYEKRKEILGETHPQTLTTKHDIEMMKINKANITMH